MAVSRSGDFAAGSWIGRAVPRGEDERLVTGRGRYVGDVVLPGTLHLEFARSLHPRGRLRGVDVAAAAEAPGVVAVWTAADLPLPGAIAVNPLVPGIRVPPFRPLARETVEAVGHPVAAVVATSLAAARDAVGLVVADVDALPPLADSDENEPVYRQAVVTEGVAEAFAQAAHVVEVSFRHARVAPAPLEPRGALADWNGSDGRLTVYLPTQTPHRAREDLARALGLAEDRVRVVAPDVGGAFGGRASIYPEDVIVAAAATRLGRPVRWTGSRTEDFLAATQGRGGRMEGAMALDASGRALAVRARIAMPLGHWLPYSAVVPGRNALRILPGPYAIDRLDATVEGRRESAAAVNIYRGAGRPEAAMLMERLMDAAAAATGIDRLEIRRRNLVAAADLPRRTPTGETLDSGDFAGLLERARDRLGADGGPAALAARRAAGEVVGLGVAIYVEPCGQGPESAAVALGANGRIQAATGSTAQGQGRETAVAQIVADGLGLPLEAVNVLHGDTATTPKGIGALASRSTAVGGSAMAVAVEAFKERARERAARRLGCAPAHVAAIAPGFVALDGSGRSIGWADLADDAEPLEVRIEHTPAGEAWSSGAAMAVVSIDRDTGVTTVERLVWADDAGRVVNPMLVEGQLLGGAAQGLGEALMEAIVYDTDGQLLTGSFMDYAVPRAADVPAIEIEKAGTPSVMNRLGAKGVGEAGTIAMPTVLTSAILDALAAAGAAPVDMPFTPAKLWAALAAARRDTTP